MKRIPWLIPVACFILALFSGILYRNYRITSLEHLIDTARSQGKPIILVYHRGNPVFQLRAYDLAGNSAVIGNQYGTNRLYPFCDENGDMLYWGYYKPDYEGVLYRIPLNDLRPVVQNVVSENVYGYIPGNYRFYAINVLTAWRTGDLNMRPVMKNMINGDQISLDLEEGVPWQNMTFDRYDSVQLATNKQGSPFYGWYTRDLNGAEVSDLWRLDVISGEWTYLKVTLPIKDVRVGPGGKVIATYHFGNSFPHHAQKFANGETGDEILYVDGGFSPVIGHRWALCHDFSAIPKLRILVFDMENEWARYELDFDSVYPNTGMDFSSYNASTLYEP